MADFPDDFDEFLTEFQRETDRAAAVLGGAYLDTRLEELFRAKLVTGPKFVEELLTDRGGLSSFSARISAAYAVGLISLPVAHDLHLVRRIRNAFSHRRQGLTFDSEPIAQWVNEFRITKELRFPNGEPLPIELGPRQRFNLAVGVLVFNGIESRIRQLPKFVEQNTGDITVMSPDNNSRQ